MNRGLFFFIAAALGAICWAPPAAAKSGANKPAAAAEASRAFKEGQRLFESADYLGAIESFAKAHRLQPHHTVLCNIALCHENLGDMVAAALSYKRCLDEGAARSPSAPAVTASLRKVEARITWVEVRARKPGGVIYIDGREIGKQPRRVPLNPGSRVIEIRRKGARPATTSLHARGGEHSVELSLELNSIKKKPVPERPAVRRRGLSQIWFWGAAGLTVVLATVATIMGVQTLNLRDDYVASPSRDLLDDGKDRRLVTNVLWGLAAAAAGTTTVLFFFTDFGSGERRASRGATSLGLGLRGSF